MKVCVCAYACVCQENHGSLEFDGAAVVLRLSGFIDFLFIEDRQEENFIVGKIWDSNHYSDTGIRDFHAFVVTVPQQEYIPVCSLVDKKRKDYFFFVLPPPRRFCFLLFVCLSPGFCSKQFATSTKLVD